MIPNFLIILLAAIVPLIIGFIWYNPKVFGTAWMNASGMTEEKAKGANMPLVFGLTFVFSIFIAFTMNFIVIHQWSFYSILANEPGFNDPNSEIGKFISGFMEKYGNNFRTFKHGALHGTISGIFFVFPIIAINALFERKSFKYIFINAGYWTLCFAVMGGIICAFP
ncbi:MAG TPA: DUF1761 domain-containing protein [Bacteroidia bacterium]|nr:DUF1761 domain-containing protein [Bacteroidia bacterium]